MTQNTAALIRDSRGSERVKLIKSDAKLVYLFIFIYSLVFISLY